MSIEIIKIVNKFKKYIANKLNIPNGTKHTQLTWTIIKKIREIDPKLSPDNVIVKAMIDFDTNIEKYRLDLSKKLDINLESINARINDEVCYITIESLKDVNLMAQYKECKSVIKAISGLKEILDKHKIDNKKQNLILNDYLLELIPAGTKGVIRGNKFNSIVKDTIKLMKLDEERFEICFEKECEDVKTSEKPDWYIQDKSTKKVLIGMNQLDLVGGGQQLNRGYKYLIDSKYNTDTSCLLCVICNYIQFKNNNKQSKLFEIGFKNNTLTYLKNLENIIKTYFII